MKPITCSWCATYRPGQDARVVGASATGGHGICEECKLLFMAEAAAGEGAMDMASPCCGVIGDLVLGGRWFGWVWRRCRCGHIYVERGHTKPAFRR